uniref:Uncharacterized protein n=1 Tax=Romanomermis culicivorax TaxID=13658 RepID=A0A915IWY2_ROMCU
MDDHQPFGCAPMASLMASDFSEAALFAE